MSRGSVDQHRAHRFRHSVREPCTCRRVLHVISRSHITRDYFEFIGEISELEVDHVALVPPRDPGWEPSPQFSVVRPANRLLWLWRYVQLSTRSQKVIVHGLAGGWVTVGLAIAPWSLSRGYWLIWGADLYDYRRRSASLKSRSMELVRRFVIRRIGHLVTYIEGDVELAREWYGAAGEVHDCLLYPGNTLHELEPNEVPKDGLRVQVGNSSDPENRHEEIFRALAALPGSFTVVAPLAYGDSRYRERVLESGRQLFGDRFCPQIELLPFADYLKQLQQVDVAIFAHRRQQGMGNCIALLGMGKRVIIRRSTSQWRLLCAAGISLSALEDGIILARLDDATSNKNRRLVGTMFSRERLAAQWRDILAAASR